MGVDYYECKSCGESRYEEYVGWCQSCGAKLCTHCLINNDIGSRFSYDYGLVFYKDEPEEMKKIEEMGFDLYDDKGNPYYEDGDIIDDSSIQPKYCPFCSGDEINKDELYDFILEKYNLSESEEWKDYKKNKK